MELGSRAEPTSPQLCRHRGPERTVQTTLEHRLPDSGLGTASGCTQCWGLCGAGALLAGSLGPPRPPAGSRPLQPQVLLAGARVGALAGAQRAPCTLQS